MTDRVAAVLARLALVESASGLEIRRWSGLDDGAEWRTFWGRLTERPGALVEIAPSERPSALVKWRLTEAGRTALEGHREAAA